MRGADAVALISFSPADASFTTAAGGPVDNWIGRPGAYAASIAML
ncbi:MAG: DNA translocase FtsK 4TM domain-containing protein, partial [Sphingopyxis sp.]